MISCFTSNLLHARDSLRDRQIYRTFIEQIVCSSNSWLVVLQTFLLMFLHMSSIFDKVEFLRVCSFKCVSFEIVFSSQKTRTNTTKTLFSSSIIERTDSFDSMCSISFMMKRFCMKSVKIEFDRYIHLDFR